MWQEVCLAAAIRLTHCLLVFPSSSASGVSGGEELLDLPCQLCNILYNRNTFYTNLLFYF